MPPYVALVSVFKFCASRFCTTHACPKMYSKKLINMVNIRINKLIKDIDIIKTIFISFTIVEYSHDIYYFYLYTRLKRDRYKLKFFLFFYNQIKCNNFIISFFYFKKYFIFCININ